MNRFFWGVSLSAVCVGGCSSARIAGGYTVSPRSAPDGELVAAYRLEHCEDSLHRPLPASHARVSVVRLIDRSIVLVEARKAYDTLVVDNVRVEGSARVFDLEIKRAASGPYLRRYRVPMKPTEPGQFVIASDFTETKTARAFSTAYKSADLVCALLPEGA